MFNAVLRLKIITNGQLTATSSNTSSEVRSIIKALAVDPPEPDDEGIVNHRAATVSAEYDYKYRLFA